MNRVLRGLFVLVGTSVSLCATTHAQDAPATVDNGGLQEIVVSATRHSESISKVALSVTAITPEAIEQKGLKNIEDIARFTPGVTFNAASNQIAIRGIASTAGSGTTGIYLDDTPIQMRELGFSADDSLPAIFDLQRVEILRGPQGTLFGAGSEGGTVRYITTQPGLVEYSGMARAELSGTQDGGPSYEAGAAFGGPIVKDKLGFRVSAWYRNAGGYVDRVDTFTGNSNVEKNANYSEHTSLRAAFTWAPIEGLTITPSVLHQKIDFHDADTYFVSISDPSDGSLLNGAPQPRGSNDNFTLPAVYVKYEAGPVSLISNTSYFTRDDLTGYDGTLYLLSYLQSTLPAGSPYYPLLQPTGINPAVSYYTEPSVVTNNQRNFTEEFRAQSNNPNARLNWVAGVFFQRNEQHSSEELVDATGDRLYEQLFGITAEDYWGYTDFVSAYGRRDAYIDNTDSVDKQTALFADVSYKITHQVKLDVGGRYAWTNYSFNNFADGADNGLRTTGSGATSEHPFTPKAGLSYQMTDSDLFYFTYSQGFRVGGANAPVPYNLCKSDLQQLGLTSSPDAYKSDSVKSYEIGAKDSLLDNRLQFATSVYTIKWTDIQQPVYLNGCGVQFTGNLGEATSRGFDVQGQFRPIPSLTISTTVGYTDAYYTQDLRTGGPTSKPVVSSGDAIGGDLAPWTFAVGAQQTLPLLDRRTYIRVDYEFRSRLNRDTQSLDPKNQSYDSRLRQAPSTGFMSLRAGVMLDNANISLFVDNVLNSLPQLSYTHEDRNTALFEATTFRPRTIGVTATYSFH